MSKLEGWWCPACRRIVPCHEVTYEEYHSCGCYVGDCQDDSDEDKYAFVDWVLNELAGRIIRLENQLESKNSWIYEGLHEMHKFIEKAYTALQI